MPVEVIMPKVDMDMSSGRISRWHVAEGERVARGAPLFDIETDKAAMEVEAPESGILRHPAPVGSEVPIGQPIAWLYAEGEAVGPTPGAAAAAPTAASAAAAADGPADGGAADEGTDGAAAGEGLRATPLARRLAARHGIDLAAVAGSGPRGRIGRADVEAAQAAMAAAPAAAPAPAAPAPAPALAAQAAMAATPALAAPAAARPAGAVPPAYAGRDHTEVPLDGMRRTLAARLTEAKQTVPHFYLRREVVLDALMAQRAEINAALAARGVKLTVNDFVIKACAAALQAVPEANAIWAGDRLLRFARSDLAVAVAVEGGLFTPVIRDADLKSVAALSAEMKRLKAKARERRLRPEDYAGGSLTVSNLGMHGVEGFDAIINPPQAAILAVGAGRPRLIVGEGGAPRVATVMQLTLSVDHRVIDGAVGAALLGEIVGLLENPLALLA